MEGKLKEEPISGFEDLLGHGDARAVYDNRLKLIEDGDTAQRYLQSTSGGVEQLAKMFMAACDRGLVEGITSPASTMRLLEDRQIFFLWLRVKPEHAHLSNAELNFLAGITR